MKKLLLIDTFNFLHRAFHALPKTFKDANNEPTNAVYGVTSMLINIFDTLKPDYAVAALDGEKPTFRVGEFTGYKAHRAEIDPDLASQIPKVFEILDAFGVKKIVVEGYEADDVIGTLVTKLKAKTDIVIASNDRDLWQLVGKNVAIMLPTKEGPAEWLWEREVKARLGFEPKLLADYKALRGDPSDNIPGVYGVGEKTAQDLVERYGCIEEIYRHISEIIPVSLKGKLANNAEEAVLSKKLALIVKDVPLYVSLEECEYREFNKAAVVEVLKKYNFKSLIRRLGFEIEDKKKKPAVPENQVALV